MKSFSQRKLTHADLESDSIVDRGEGVGAGGGVEEANGTEQRLKGWIILKDIVQYLNFSVGNGKLPSLDAAFSRLLLKKKQRAF